MALWKFLLLPHTYTQKDTYLSEIKNVNHLLSKDQEDFGKLLTDVDIKVQVFEKSSKWIFACN